MNYTFYTNWSKYASSIEEACNKNKKNDLFNLILLKNKGCQMAEQSENTMFYCSLDVECFNPYRKTITKINLVLVFADHEAFERLQKERFDGIRGGIEDWLESHRPNVHVNTNFRIAVDKKGYPCKQQELCTETDNNEIYNPDYYNMLFI